MEASKRVAVTRATGRVGRHVVDLLEARGHDIVALLLFPGVGESGNLDWTLEDALRLLKRGGSRTRR